MTAVFFALNLIQILHFRREMSFPLKNNVEQYELEVAFWAYKEVSPLPGYYLDEFAWEDAQQIEGISAFSISSIIV